MHNQQYLLVIPSARNLGPHSELPTSLRGCCPRASRCHPRLSQRLLVGRPAHRQTCQKQTPWCCSGSNARRGARRRAPLHSRQAGMAAAAHGVGKCAGTDRGSGSFAQSALAAERRVGTGHQAQGSVAPLCGSAECGWRPRPLLLRRCCGGTVGPGGPSHKRTGCSAAAAAGGCLTWQSSCGQAILRTRLSDSFQADCLGISKAVCAADVCRHKI
jgi:hypothetical protein